MIMTPLIHHKLDLKRVSLPGAQILNDRDSHLTPLRCIDHNLLTKERSIYLISHGVSVIVLKLLIQNWMSNLAGMSLLKSRFWIGTGGRGHGKGMGICYCAVDLSAQVHQFELKQYTYFPGVSPFSMQNLEVHWMEGFSFASPGRGAGWGVGPEDGAGSVHRPQKEASKGKKKRSQ